jgi:glyoxylase-like metal-dependent hydrolase (beta-lactamase superfamily II)
MVQQVPAAADIYYVDVPMLGNTGVNSPYIIDGPEPTIVDTGSADGVEQLFEGLGQLGIQPDAVSYIIPTHAHLDHAGGAGYLAERCENASVICHQNAVDYLTDEEKLEQLSESVERAIGMASPYGEPTVIDPDRCMVFEGGESIELGNRILDFIDAPGHAPHQLCVYDRSTDMLFSADANGMHFEDDHRPTTPPPNFDLEQTLETVERLASFSPETLLYPHFGPGEEGEAMAELRTYQETLPGYVQEVADARQKHGDDVGAIMLAMDDRWNHWALGTDIAGILRYLENRP